MFYNMVDVSALNALIAYLFLNQGAFGSRARPTRRSLLIQLRKELAATKISNQAAPLLVSLVTTKICHLALHRRNDITAVHCPSKKDRKTLCVPCVYNTAKMSVVINGTFDEGQKSKAQVRLRGVTAV